MTNNDRHYDCFDDFEYAAHHTQTREARYDAFDELDGLAP